MDYYSDIYLKQIDARDYREFARMSEAYYDELMEYCSLGVPATWEPDDFMEREDRRGYMIRSKFRSLGFLLCDYGKNMFGNECYIQQFYVEPDYRREGVGSKAIEHLAKMESGISLHIMKRNDTARKFWNSIFTELNFEEQFGKENLVVETDGGECEFFYWKKNGIENEAHYAVSQYYVGTSFVAGEKIYRYMSELTKERHEDFSDTYYDVYGRMVLTKSDARGKTVYYMLLDGEEIIQIHRNRTTIFVVEDEKMMNRQLVDKVGRIRQYCGQVRR